MFSVLRETWKLLKRLSIFVNSLPLGGKLNIRKYLYSAYSGSPEQRLTKSLFAIFILIVMILGHGVQVIMGLALMNKGVSLPVTLVGLSYMVVNAMVVYTQCILFIRLIIHLIRFRNRGYSVINPKPYSFGYQLLCMVVTLGGQIVFGLVYIAHIYI